MLVARAAALGDACGHRWIAATARWTAAKVALDRAEPPAAVALAAHALVQHAADYDIPSTLVLGHTLALAAEGDTDRAVRLLAAVRAHAARVGSSPEMIDTACHLTLIGPLLAGEAAAALLAEGRGWRWEDIVDVAATVRRTHGSLEPVSW
jgi:ATP/maltotriose-dependent transcriptional regulator MalT